MKSLIITALVLGLTVMSCKKEAQTAKSADSDSLSAVDSMNSNSSSPAVPSDSMTNMQSTSDSAGVQNNRDSIPATPK